MPCYIVLIHDDIKKNQTSKIQERKAPGICKKKKIINKKIKGKKKKEETRQRTHTFLLGVTIRLLVDVDGLNTQYPNKILKIRCIYPTLGSKDTGRRRTKHNVYLLK